MTTSLEAPSIQSLVVEYLAPKLGGSSEAWSEANMVVAEREFERYKVQFRGHVDRDYLAFREQWFRRWLSGMVELVGVDAPQGEEFLRLVRETGDFVTRLVRSSYPGVVDAINELHADGYTLYTASGEDSEDLEGYLEGLSVREQFVMLYGPDLVNTPKEVPEYCIRLFEDAGVASGRAVVVDDSPSAVSWAREGGATAVLVSAVDNVPPNSVIRSLAELATFIAAIP